MSLPGRLLSHIQFLKNPIFDRTTPLSYIIVMNISSIAEDLFDMMDRPFALLKTEVCKNQIYHIEDSRIQMFFVLLLIQESKNEKNLIENFS